MQPDIYPIAYSSGEFLAWNQVQISPLDRGFLFGEGLYATIAVVTGQALFIEDHLCRLKQACAELNFPSDGADWQEVVTQLISLNKIDSAGVSVIVTRGVDKVRHHLPMAEKPTVLAFAYPWKPSVIRRPVVANIQDDPRALSYSHLKINSLLPNVQASQKAHQQGFDKVIFHRDDIIVEAAQANLFWIKEGQLFTASTDLPLVCGITRRLVLRIAADMGLSVHQGHYPLDDLLSADEVFLCATLTQITPISKIGLSSYQQPGPLTQKIAEAYADLCNKQVLLQKEAQEQQQGSCL